MVFIHNSSIIIYFFQPFEHYLFQLFLFVGNIFEIGEDDRFAAVLEISFEQPASIVYLGAARENEHDAAFEKVKNRDFTPVFFRIEIRHFPGIVEARVVPLDALADLRTDRQHDAADGFYRFCQHGLQFGDVRIDLFTVGKFGMIQNSRFKVQNCL